MTDILLITEQSIKNLTNISDNMSGKLLLPAIRESQEINLREILGDALLDELKRQVEIDDVRETYGNLLLQCQYYLAYQSCANICMITSVKIDNAGLQRVSDEKMEPLPVSEVNQIHDYYQQKADFYCERLQHFLLQNKDDYPQLNTRQCNAINSNLYSSASCGIFLGGPRSKNVDKGYGDGLNSSKSQGVERLDVELTENGTYDYKPKGYGYNSVHIDVNTPVINNQEKSITISENGQTSVVPDEEYTGLNKVSVNVDVHPTERLERTYTANGVYEIDGEYAGGEISVDVKQGQRQFDGHVDVEGLKELGWTDDDIKDFQANVWWYSWQDDDYKVSDYDKNLEIKDSYKGDTKLKYPKMQDTSARENFYQMFYQCSNLIAVPKFDMSSATSTWSMFASSSVGYNNLDLSHVNDVTDMFYEVNVRSLPTYDFSNVNNISECYRKSEIESCNILNFTQTDWHNAIFDNCKKLQYVKLTNCKITSLYNMFLDCKKLKKIDGLNWENITSASSAFEGTNFTELNIPCTKKLTNVSGMIRNMYYLEKVEFGDTTGFYNAYQLFYYDQKLTTIKNLNLSGLTYSPSQIFYYCTSLTDIDIVGYINYSLEFNESTKLTYDSIKSILTACSKTTNSNTKTVSFNRTIADQNNELTNLVSTCTEKGWTVSGLTITQ